MQTGRTTHLAAGMVLSALVLAVTACAGSSGDKAGGDPEPQQVLLKFANITGSTPPQLQAFADEVDRRSDGTLRIKFKPEWRGGDPDAELGTIKDVQAGKVDMAWVGARVFDTLGVESFQALLAPLLVDSYELEARVFESGIPASMLEGVDELGVVGIGILPGPIRRLIGVSHPFLQPSDFDSQVIGGSENELSVRTFEALGATIEALPAGGPLDGLDATEQHLAAIWDNRYNEVAKYVGANVNLWPRPLAIFAGEEVFESLTAEHQAVLREAATAAIPAALEAARAEDEDATVFLCSHGTTFEFASESELAELRRALGPVYAELMANPETKANIDAISNLKAEIAAPAEAPTCSSIEQPGASSPIPDGRYEMTLTKDDWLNAGVPKERWMTWQSTGRYVMIFDSSELSIITPNGGEGFEASYTVFRDQIEAQENTDYTVVARWSLNDDTLSFSDISVPGAPDASVETVTWSTHPWVRVD